MTCLLRFPGPLPFLSVGARGRWAHSYPGSHGRAQHAKQNDEAQVTTMFLKDPITAPMATRNMNHMMKFRARVTPRPGLCTARTHVCTHAQTRKCRDVLLQEAKVCDMFLGVNRGMLAFSCTQARPRTLKLQA